MSRFQDCGLINCYYLFYLILFFKKRYWDTVENWTKNSLFSSSIESLHCLQRMIFFRFLSMNKYRCLAFLEKSDSINRIWYELLRLQTFVAGTAELLPLSLSRKTNRPFFPLKTDSMKNPYPKINPKIHPSPIPHSRDQWRMLCGCAD